MSMVNSIIYDLSHRKSSVACGGKGGLRMYLRQLGFEDTEGKTTGHRIFTHKKLTSLTSFISFSVDCGHKPNRGMKMPYVVKTINILKQYQDFFEEFEGDQYA